MVVDQLSVEASGTVTCEVDTQVQSNQFLIPAELTTASLTITISKIYIMHISSMTYDMYIQLASTPG